MNSLDTEAIISPNKFIEQTGLSAVTVRRYRKKGMLTAVNICGRQYVLRAEIACFNERASAGEFTKPPNQPGKRCSAPTRLGTYGSDSISGRTAIKRSAGCGGDFGANLVANFVSTTHSTRALLRSDWNDSLLFGTWRGLVSLLMLRNSFSVS